MFEFYVEHVVLKLTRRQKFAMRTSNFKFLSVVILNSTTDLVSWTTIELIFKVVLVRFLFHKVMISNF